MSEEVKTSIHLLMVILGAHAEPTTEGLNELLEVKRGNKKVILEHLKAIHNIMGEAIKDLEENK